VEAELGGDKRAGLDCPVDAFLSRWAMLESGLPVGLDSVMNTTCQPLLKRILGATKYEEYR
jgi:hypothetical protein